MLVVNHLRDSKVIGLGSVKIDFMSVFKTFIKSKDFVSAHSCYGKYMYLNEASKL